MATTAQVYQLYLAYFGRPPDFTGLNSFANSTPAQVQAIFSASAESRALLGSTDTATQVNNIYQNLFGRDAETAGLAYWVNEIASGRVTLASAAFDILNGARNADATVVANRIEVAQAFVANYSATTAGILGYVGDAAASNARTFLRTVTDTAASKTAALAGVPAAVTATVALGSSTSGTSGATVTLTSGADVVNTTTTDAALRTTAFNDTIVGGVAKLNTDDVIDGGAGTDTLSVTVGTADIAANIRNVENINLTFRSTSTGDVSLADVAGESVVTIDGAPSTNSAQIIGIDQTATVAFANGTTGIFTLVLADAGGTADSITIRGNGASAFAFDLATAATGGGIETINLSGALTIGNSALSSAVDLGNANKLSISGSGDVTLALGAGTGGSFATGATALSAIDAASLTGKLNLTLGSANMPNAITITGGAGNDTINMSTTLGTLDSINGGGGTDTVSFSVENGLSTISPKLTSVETVSVGVRTAATVDFTNATAISSLTVAVAQDTSASVTEIAGVTTTLLINSAASGSDVNFAYVSGVASNVTLTLAAGGTATAGITADTFSFESNTGSLTFVSDGVTGNALSALSANSFGALTINANRGLSVNGDVFANAANTVSIAGAAGVDISIDSASFNSAATVTISTLGSSNFSANNLTLAPAGALNVNASNVANIDVLTIGRTATTAGTFTVGVTVGSGGTVTLADLDMSANISAIGRVNYTLAGSGSVVLGFSAGGINGATASANINASSLGGSLTINATAVTSGIEFNVTLGNGSGNTVALGFGADTVQGGSTGDTIEGGGGNDRLFGGLGNDVFVYDNARSTADAGAIIAANGSDVIGDMGSADIIRFVGLTAIGLFRSAAALTAATFSGSFTAAPGAGVVAVFQRGDDVVVQVFDGTGNYTNAGAVSGSYVEIVLAGETLGTNATAAIVGGVLELTNLVQN